MLVEGAGGGGGNLLSRCRCTSSKYRCRPEGLNSLYELRLVNWHSLITFEYYIFQILTSFLAYIEPWKTAVWSPGAIVKESRISNEVFYKFVIKDRRYLHVSSIDVTQRSTKPRRRVVLSYGYLTQTKNGQNAEIWKKNALPIASRKEFSSPIWPTQTYPWMLPC